MKVSDVESFIVNKGLLKKGDGVVVGVSGGPDSMCLLFVLQKLSKAYDLNLHCVHINHKIRGIDADKDMEFVQKYCKDNDLTCHTYCIDIPALSKKRGESSEETGRIERYKAFNEVFLETNSTKIATAHNADDNVETVIFNALRGAGLSGICGILAKRDNIIRPLIPFTKKEILEFLNENGISYCIDKTNEGEDYTRNKIRNVVIPYIEKEINNSSVKHLSNLSRMAFEINEYIKEDAKNLFEKLKIPYENGVCIKRDEFIKLRDAVKPYIVRLMIEEVCGRLKDITNTHIMTVCSLVNFTTGAKADLPYDLEGFTTSEVLVVAQKSENVAIGEICEIKDYGTYNVSAGNFSVERDNPANVVKSEKKCTKWFACDILKNNTVIRHRQDGDFIVINKKGDKKKLNDYLTDIKYPRNKRDSLYVLACGHDILWVVGYRISEKYKVLQDENGNFYEGELPVIKVCANIEGLNEEA